MICNVCNESRQSSDFWANQSTCKPCLKRFAAEQRDRANATAAALTYGVEIEVNGLSVQRGATVLREVVDGGPLFACDHHGQATRAADGRVWKSVHDGSVDGCEIVTPVLRAADKADMETLQKVVRALRAAGATVSSQTGIHVHVGAEPMGGIVAIARLARLGTVVEPCLVKGLDVDGLRLSRFCKPMDRTLAAKLRGVETEDQMATAWYGTADNRYERTDHYHGSRYRGINLHSYWSHATAEFRWFNGSVHAGKVRAYVELSLALAVKAASSKTVPSKSFDRSREGGVKLLKWLGITDKTVVGHILDAGFPVASTDAVAA
jgi:hypothetical protein